MKKTVILIWLVFAIFSCGTGGMKLAGEWLSAKDGEMLYLSRDGYVDSAVVKNGKFEFALANAEPYEYVLSRENNGKREILLVYLDYCSTYIKLSDETERMWNKNFIKCEILGNPVGAIVWDLVYFALKTQSPFEDSALLQRLRDVAKRGDMASAYALYKYGAIFTCCMDYDEVMGYWNQLPEEIKQSTLGKEVQTEIAKKLPLTKGGVAPDFTLNTPEGKSVVFSEFIKGKKAVLINFWGSIYPPCRKKNEEILALYNKFHEKGFDVIGVSLDSEKEAWVKAIEEDKMPWPQVSELKGMDGNMRELYDFVALPNFVLVDGSGKVLANLQDWRRGVTETVENIFK